MGEKSVDELHTTLGLITLYKSMLPFSLRGWVSALGLHVQERKAGRQTRLLAGGSFRSYLDAWQENEGAWQVKKFDEDTWERRFAHVVQPSIEIAEFLIERVANFGDLDAEGADALNSALHRYKTTGEWLALPKVSERVKQERRDQEARRRAQEERPKRLALISQTEKRVRADPQDRLGWFRLHPLYCREGRYKDMEKALTMLLQIDGRRYSRPYMQLGELYLTALSNHIRGKGIDVRGDLMSWGDSIRSSDVTSEILGHSIEELSALAKRNFSTANEIDGEIGWVRELPDVPDLAIRAATELSSAAFDQFDSYKQEHQRELQEQSRKERESQSSENKNI